MNDLETPLRVAGLEHFKADRLIDGDHVTLFKTEAHNFVLASGTDINISAAAPAQLVITGTSIEQIISFAALQRVITVEPLQRGALLTRTRRRN